MSNLFDLPVILSALYLLGTALILRLVLVFNRRAIASFSGIAHPAEPAFAPTRPGQGELSAESILGWEFEYARVTASEAMHDRHTMVNYYLTLVSIAVSGAVATIGAELQVPANIGAILLWLLCGVGWLYFLKLVRLRQAWHDSAQAMNQIKAFYLRHNQEFDAVELRRAFRWQPDSLPTIAKSWTLFFYSAMLIGFLSSAAFVMGGLFLDIQATQSSSLVTVGAIVGLGILFFLLHYYFYFAFLGQSEHRQNQKDGNRG